MNRCRSGLRFLMISIAVGFGQLTMAPIPILAQETATTELLAEKLVGEFWQRSSADEQNVSRRLGEEALRQTPGDRELQYAYALNRMQHFRYQDAAKLLQNVVTEEPGRISAWQLLTWTQLVTGQHDQCLISLREMKKQIATQPGLDDQQVSSAFKHAGRLIGFMQGPASFNPNPDLLNLTINAIANGATAEQLEHFNLERDALLQKFDAISKAEAQAAANFLQEEAAKGAVQAAAIESSSKTLAQQREQIQPEVSRLTSEANSLIANLDSQARPLLAEATAADATANQLAWTLNDIRGDIFFNQQALANEEDPSRQYFIQLRLNRLYSMASQTQFDLSAVRSRLAGLQSQLNVMGVQRNQIGNSYGSQISQTKNEIHQIDRQQRKNDAKLQDIIDGPDQMKGEALRLANKKDLLSTYYVPALEIYRLEFLDELDSKK